MTTEPKPNGLPPFDTVANLARRLIAVLDQPFRYPGEIKTARDSLARALEAMNGSFQAAVAKPDDYAKIGLLEWAVERWRSSVQNRPLVNIRRRTMDDCWRSVMRYAGGDPDALVGPSHDDLLAAQEQTK